MIVIIESPWVAIYLSLVARDSLNILESVVEAIVFLRQPHFLFALSEAASLLR